MSFGDEDLISDWNSVGPGLLVDPLPTAGGPAWAFFESVSLLSNVTVVEVVDDDVAVVDADDEEAFVVEQV